MSHPKNARLVGPNPSATATLTATSSATLLGLGGLGGLAWAASLRGFMTQVAGPESSASWAGTFGWILLPGVITGVLLAWSEQLRRTGGVRGWRWLATAPLAFAAVLVPALLDPATMFEGGVGAGAVGVPLFAMAGGYAVSGRGPALGRFVCGALFLAIIPIWAFTVPSFGGPDLAVDTPRGLWVALYYWSLMAVLALACAIPHRPVITPRPTGAPSFEKVDNECGQ